MQFLRSTGAWGAGPPSGLVSGPAHNASTRTAATPSAAANSTPASSWASAVTGRAFRSQPRPAGAGHAAPRLEAGRMTLGLPATLSPRRGYQVVTAAIKEDSGTSSLAEGLLVEFSKDGNMAAGSLGRLQRPDGKKNWIVLDQAGNSFSLRPQQIQFVVPGSVELEAELADFDAEVESMADQGLLELAWGIMLDGTSATIRADDLAEVLFGDRAGGAASCAAHRLLARDRVYFKRKGKGTSVAYELRDEAQVAKLKVQVAAEEAAAERAAAEAAEEQEALGRFIENVKAAAALGFQERPGAVEWREGEYGERVLAIESYALEEAGREEISLAEECLHVLSRRKTSGAAAELLGQIGVWLPHESVAVRKAGLEAEFTGVVMEEAKQLLASPPADLDADGRMDLTHLKVFTIDDETTSEIDDGLSVEKLEDGRWRVWIHVADPTRYIRPGTALDLEARSRATSVYLPTGTVPMFPWDLAAGPFSLRQGEESCAMSVGAVLGDDGGLEEYAMVPSKIRVTYRLTYEDSDELIMHAEEGQEPELAILHEIGDRRHAWRQAQGAIEIQMPEAYVKVKSSSDGSEPEVTVDGMDMNTQSRIMVAELMILSGEVSSAIGQELGVPLPYRGQPEPDLPASDELMALPPGPCRAVALRRCMTRSTQSIAAPMRHAALGLDGYVQFSSPIRRYTDLLAHWQLKAVLRGEDPPFGQDDLAALVHEASALQREMSSVERGATRFWTIHYLAGCLGEPHEAMMLRWLREDMGLASVLLVHLGLELPAKLQGSWKPGDMMMLKVTSADPREDVLRLTEA